MSYFKAKMHEIRFRLRLRPRSRWGAYIAPPNPKLDLRGPTSNRKGKGKKGRRGGKGRRGERKS